MSSFEVQADVAELRLLRLGRLVRVVRVVRVVKLFRALRTPPDASKAVVHGGVSGCYQYISVHAAMASMCLHLLATAGLHVQLSHSGAPWVLSQNVVWSPWLASGHSEPRQLLAFSDQVHNSWLSCKGLCTRSWGRSSRCFGPSCS